MNFTQRRIKMVLEQQGGLTALEIGNRIDLTVDAIRDNLNKMRAEGLVTRELVKGTTSPVPLWSLAGSDFGKSA